MLSTISLESSVRRILVEKRRGFDLEARALKRDLIESLHIDTIENVRILCLHSSLRPGTPMPQRRKASVGQKTVPSPPTPEPSEDSGRKPWAPGEGGAVGGESPGDSETHSPYNCE